jgi:glyoxalase family protein
MLDQIKGLHHVTSMASDARSNNAFFTDTLGLRRVKKTVNFDAPDVYHLYYADEFGTPGTVMTYFPFPNIGPAARARRGRHHRLCRAGGLAQLLEGAVGDEGVKGLEGK